MKFLVFVACMMTDVGTCQEVEVSRPPAEPLALCSRQAPTIMRQWREQGHAAWFIRHWRCMTVDHSA